MNKKPLHILCLVSALVIQQADKVRGPIYPTKNKVRGRDSRQKFCVRAYGPCGSPTDLPSQNGHPKPSHSIQPWTRWVTASKPFPWQTMVGTGLLRGIHATRG